ncbi:MAG TPA: hypothetical protein DF294_05420 [Psychrobacter sp.]|nr:hypothetical protein [Psychrobacter sp.]
MFGIMFKQIFITLICFSFLFLATACQAEKEVVIPPHAIISVEESPETFKKNNEDIKQYWKFNDNPLNISSSGVTFYDLSFPSDNYANVTFTYPNVPPISIENVSSTSGYFDHDRPERGIQYSTIRFFITDSKGSYGITQKDAYIAMQKLFNQLEEKGWQDDHRVTSPRISVQDSYVYGTSENVISDNVNYNYPLDFEQFRKLDSYHSWSLRHGTDVFLDVSMSYNFEEEIGNYVYMISLYFMSEENYLNSYVSYDNIGDTWEALFKEIYPYLAEGRLQSETQALEIGLKIQQDQPDYTLPLILEKTGIDTSKFVSIDPYKITYKEFMKRSEVGEDMTPYYENQPTAKP